MKPSADPGLAPLPSLGTHHAILHAEAQLVLGVGAPDDSGGDRGTVHDVQRHFCLVLQLLEDGMGLCQTLVMQPFRPQES